MRRRLNEIAWDARMILGSRRVYPRGPWAWFRWRVVAGVRLRRGTPG